MPRSEEVYLKDIRKSIRQIVKYTKNFSFDRFASDEKTIDAVLRNLEIIGEAVKKLPESLKQQYSQIEWKKIASLRDILIHEYFGIDIEIIWDILSNKLPSLQKTINSILKKYRDEK